MTTREYLSGALYLQKEIEQLEKELGCGYISPQFQKDKVQKSFENSRENYTVNQIELQELINKKKKLLVEITYAIETVPNAKMRLILHKRYIQGMSVHRIAKEMHYEREYMFKLLRQAESMVKRP